MDPTFFSAARLSDLVRDGRIGCLELLDNFIARVERLDARINAIVARDFDRARDRARVLDSAKDRSMPLFGVPMTVKESLDVAGLATTWGLPAMRASNAGKNATSVERLLAVGAILFGKTNVPAMLADLQTFNELYGTTNNPWDVTRSPGGSSGGSAAALAAGFTGIEVGTDLGSSIRNPAHYCGVFGHKPTWGICPLSGHALKGREPYPDISVVGPLARSAEDLAIALDAMVGPEAIEGSWKLQLPPPRATSLKGMRVAVMTEHPLSEVDASITERLLALATFLRQEGATVSDTARPELDLACHHRLFIEMMFATVSADNDANAMRHWRDDASQRREDDVSFSAMMARGMSMIHGDWVVGNEQRQHMRRAWAAFFRDWDVLLCPTMASPALPHDHTEVLSRSINVNGHAVPFTDQLFWAGIASLCLLPATIAPLGFSPDGLPVGVQIVGPQYGDRTTIEVARLFEQLWQSFVPPPGWE
jgi:amidase